MTSYVDKLFAKPDAKSIAQKELADARRGLLESQKSAEYYAKMAEYYKGVETRLMKYLKD